MVVVCRGVVVLLSFVHIVLKLLPVVDTYLIFAVLVCMTLSVFSHEVSDSQHPGPWLL